MNNQIKIGVAAVVLVGMAGAAYQAQQADKKENARLTAGAGLGPLPEFKLASDDVDKITKIEVKNADKGEVVLEKDGDKWRVKKPVDYPANQQNVKSLLDNLKELKAKDVIDKGTGAYTDYQVDDAKAVHVVAYKGNDKAVDLFFGKSGGRGQTARKAGVDGVFAISGYSSYLYTREAKNWRETSILKFDDAAVTKVDLKNENGEFSFVKEGDNWTAKFKGEKAEKADKLERFDDNKLKDMLRAYKGLSADDFADGKSDTETGLDKPAATLTLTLKEGDPIKISVGKTSSGENRFLRKEGDKQIYIISSWSAGWSVAKADKFQKPEEKKDDKKDDKKKDDKKKDDKKKDDKKDDHDHDGDD
ncbi:MAG: DUF4340 domain-containing protein [Myxococcales bacterium]|nr:DUF4340 domain-containing protein [Polyangiaceae bacterium]MDW8249786.1 DUF4340 domain-containing protein [Myxococcales bacterium]